MRPHSSFIVAQLRGYVTSYFVCAQMEPLSCLGMATPLVCVAWHAKVGCSSNPHGQELHKSRASGQDILDVMARHFVFVEVTSLGLLHMTVELHMLFFEATTLLFAIEVLSTFLLFYGLLLAQAALHVCVYYGFSFKVYVLGDSFVYGIGTVYVGVQREVGTRSVRIRALLPPPPPGR